MFFLLLKNKHDKLPTKIVYFDEFLLNSIHNIYTHEKVLSRLWSNFGLLLSIPAYLFSLKKKINWETPFANCSKALSKAVTATVTVKNNNNKTKKENLVNKRKKKGLTFIF